MRDVAKNTFQDGMQSDISKHLQRSTSYRYALHGRIRFNTAGRYVSKDNKDYIGGSTAEFCTERGNLKVFSFCSGYEVFGTADFINSSIIMLGNGINSEFGELMINELTLEVEYKTLYNDRYDPNGDKLNFKKRIRSISIVEDSDKRRIYLGGDDNEPRVIDLECFYENGVPYHKGFCGSVTEKYPNWMSVHNMNAECDVYFGRLKYVKTIEGKIQGANFPIGTLKTGVYQYTYRYKTKSGYNSAWFPLINGINLTSAYYVGNVDNIPISNHHKYVMYESGITTEKSIEILVEEVDLRYYEIELAYVYSITDSSPLEFNIFERIKLSNQKSLSVVHRSHGGINAGDIQELNSIRDRVINVNEVNSINNKLLHGGLVYGNNFDVDTKTIKITPVFKEMLCDEKGVVTFTNEDDVLTNTTPVLYKDRLVSYNNKSGIPVYNEYGEVFEYMNYKGTRFEHLRTSYWRGEVYPFYLVGINRKGYHSFAILIDDYKFPEQFNNIKNTGIDARLAITEGRVRVMGAKFDGINIPKDMIYGEDGKIETIGFMICRGDRKRRILYQGVLLNCVHTPDDDNEVTNDDDTLVRNIIRATPFSQNRFSDNFVSNHIDHYGYFNSTPVIGYLGIPPPFIIPFTNVSGSNYAYMNKANWFTFNSPDISVDGGTMKRNDGDYVELAGSMYDSRKSSIHLWGGQFHVYNKAYLSDYKEKRLKYIVRNNTNRSLVRSLSNLNLNVSGFNQSIEALDTYDIRNRFDAYVDFNADFPTNENIMRAWAAPFTQLLILNDWKAADLGDENNPYRYHIVNYCRNNEQYYNKVSFGERTCFPINHYQPINEKVLSDIPLVTINGKEHYQFNGVEVWGGDCYPHLYDFMRLYPNYNECETNTLLSLDKCRRDYAVGLIIPIESNYNMMLRQGRSFAEVASQPEAAGCGCAGFNSDSFNHFIRGVNEGQPEDWNINSVLQYVEKIKLFNTKPIDYVFKKNADNRWRISQLKTYDEIVDNYRIFLVNDYLDVDSQYGRIVSSGVLFDYLVSIQEGGYGVLAINQKTAMIAEGGQEVIFGTGRNLTDIRYVSRIFGTQHRESVVVLQRSLYFYDANNRKICRYSQAGTDQISDMYGLHDTTWHISPFMDKEVVGVNGNYNVHAIKDLKNNEVIFTFLNLEFPNRGFSIVYAEDLNCFIEYFELPNRYNFNHKSFIFETSIDRRNELYLMYHGKIGHFFGEYKDTVLVYIVNHNSDLHKSFSNMSINANIEIKDRIGKVRFTSENYNDHEIDIEYELGLDDGYARFRESRLAFPMRTVRDGNVEIYDSEMRLSGNWIEVRLTIKNDKQKIDNKDIMICIQSILSEYKDNFKKIN